MEVIPQACDELWAGEEWRAEAVAWIETVTRRKGLLITGECQQPRIRFWSTQLTVPTDAGTLWFKENCPGQAFEAKVVALLAELTPDQVMVPIAVEPDRGWLLTPDGGRLIGTAAGTETDANLNVWRRVLVEWGQLQRRLADHVEPLRAAGVTLMPPEAAAELVARYTALPPGEPGHLDSGTTARVEALLPTVAEWGRQLAATGLPISLDHNDLHGYNAFEGERLQFFDFADAVLGHPLCSLMVPIRELRAGLNCADDDPRIRRLVEAYLEVWSDLVDVATLRAAVAPALRLAALHRAESWRRVLPYASAAERAEHGDPAAHHLATLAD